MNKFFDASKITKYIELVSRHRKSPLMGLFEQKDVCSPVGLIGVYRSQELLEQERIKFKKHTVHSRVINSVYSTDESEYLDMYFLFRMPELFDFSINYDIAGAAPLWMDMFEASKYLMLISGDDGVIDDIYRTDTDPETISLKFIGRFEKQWEALVKRGVDVDKYHQEVYPDCVKNMCENRLTFEINKTFMKPLSLIDRPVK